MQIMFITAYSIEVIVIIVNIIPVHKNSIKTQHSIFTMEFSQERKEQKWNCQHKTKTKITTQNKKQDQSLIIPESEANITHLHRLCCKLT